MGPPGPLQAHMAGSLIHVPHPSTIYTASSLSHALIPITPLGCACIGDDHVTAPFHTPRAAPHTAMPIVFIHALPCHIGHALPYILAIIRTPQPLPRCSNMPVPNPRCLAHLPVILSCHFGARRSHRLILQRTWSCLRHTTGMDEVQPSRHTHWHVKTCTHAARKLCRCARPHIHKCID